jgi:hypothetical protein
MNNTNPPEDIALAQMQLTVHLMDSLDLARETTEKLREAVSLLDFTKPSMIQQYYDSLASAAIGFGAIRDAFFHMASCNFVDLEPFVDDDDDYDEE